VLNRGRIGGVVEAAEVVNHPLPFFGSERLPASEMRCT
jgi:hypothetical protein